MPRVAIAKEFYDGELDAYQARMVGRSLSIEEAEESLKTFFESVCSLQVECTCDTYDATDGPWFPMPQLTAWKFPRSRNRPCDTNKANDKVTLVKCVQATPSTELFADVEEWVGRIPFAHTQK